MNCAISGAQFWIRFPGECADAIGGEATNGRNRTFERSCLRISNVKFQKFVSGDLPIMLTTSSSRVVNICTTTSAMLTSYRSKTLRDTACFPKEVLRIELLILFWDVSDDLLHIYCKDFSFVTIILHYKVPCPLATQKRLKWLRPGNCICAHAFLLQSYDAIYDVVVAMRCEHSWIAPLAIPPRVLLPVIRHASDGTQNERRKYAALQSGKSYYNLCTPFSVIRSCSERYFGGVTFYILNNPQSSLITELSSDFLLLVRGTNCQFVCLCSKRLLINGDDVECSESLLDAPAAANMVITEEYADDSTTCLNTLLNDIHHFDETSIGALCNKSAVETEVWERRASSSSSDLAGILRTLYICRVSILDCCARIVGSPS